MLMLALVVAAGSLGYWIYNPVEDNEACFSLFGALTGNNWEARPDLNLKAGGGSPPQVGPLFL